MHEISYPKAMSYHCHVVGLAKVGGVKPLAHPVSSGVLRHQYTHTHTNYFLFGETFFFFGGGGGGGGINTFMSMFVHSARARR